MSGKFLAGYTRGMPSGPNLLHALKEYWGYDSFRPLQERIVESLRAGRDTCVVMPTGGGKSLCYQLPALLSGKTAVVVSPLIALMQDQSAQLEQMGIPAAVLNSSVAGQQQAQLIREAQEGKYRLLYFSPERLARPDTMEWLQRVPIAFFAVDEAHCISEWGHEFRPEYRQLKRLRTTFPDNPIAAFTASATQRVRHDILSQLQLRNPDKYIASFHRPNLKYLIRECIGGDGEQSDLLIKALRQHSDSSVIIYAPTIEKVRLTVAFLKDHGIDSIPYHGQMEASDRRSNQERWMDDSVRVMVGTIAFGLGINKATVRTVIHLSLPKSIEQYYQEAGRAGRDGDPADCVLLWQKRDAGLLAYFIEQMNDAAEKERSWERYHTIRRFVESDICRHRQICSHFGEQAKWQSCESCDVCAELPEWLDTSTPSAKARSKISASPRRLPATVRDVRPNPITRPVADAALRESLREWRSETAKKQGVPAFVVMHDTCMDEICRVQPGSIPQLLEVHGIGERKAQMYGPEILAKVKTFRDARSKDILKISAPY